MPRDYRETVRALRAKAADKAVTSHERDALNAKADEIETAHGVGEGAFSFHFKMPFESFLDEMRREAEKDSYNRQYHDDHNGYNSGVEDQEMPANAPPSAGRYGWNPDRGKYRRPWNPYDEADLIAPEFREDWEE